MQLCLPRFRLARYGYVGYWCGFFWTNEWISYSKYGILERLSRKFGFELKRAFATSADERLTRELVLQLKFGEVETDYFRQKFGVEIIDKFRSSLQKLSDEQMLTFDSNRIKLTQQGLLRVDQLLPEFYAEKYQNARYT